MARPSSTTLTPLRTITPAVFARFAETVLKRALPLIPGPDSDHNPSPITAPDAGSARLNRTAAPPFPLRYTLRGAVFAPPNSVETIHVFICIPPGDYITGLPSNVNTCTVPRAWKRRSEDRPVLKDHRELVLTSFRTRVSFASETRTK